MNIVSLFDGISCARVALDRAGIPVKTYYASEIDKNAIAISQKNYPDIVRLGDVRHITHIDEPIYLLIGGSPCQDLSIAKKDRKGLAGDRSSLFYEYVRILKLLKPKYFILENVASMPKADKDIITKELGVEPVLFNASLVSAQCRKRLFWTNIQFDLPEDKGIKLKDILQPDAEVDESMVVNGKAFCLTASYSKVSPSEAQINNSREKKQRTMVMLSKPKENEFIQIGYFGAENHCKVGGQALRVYTDEGKSTTSGIGLYAVNGSAIRGRQNEEGKWIQTLDVRDDEKANAVVGFPSKTCLVKKEAVIRKLTPIECERLQCLPDKYTEGVAKTHRYKCLGNAFNVDVIAHILKQSV